MGKAKNAARKMPGPKSLFRGKVLGSPVSSLLTPAGHVLDQETRERLGRSRGDLYELLLIYVNQPGVKKTFEAWVATQQAAA